MDSGPGLGFAKREGNLGLSPKLAVWEADLTSGHIKSCCGEVVGVSDVKYIPTHCHL